jgi:hypothetical protein
VVGVRADPSSTRGLSERIHLLSQPSTVLASDWSPG